MSIHLSTLLNCTRIASNLCRRPYLLGCSVAKRNLQEFPETKVNNVRPNDYLIVLPEPTNEKSGSNEILRLPKVGEPEIDFNKITVESAFKGLSQAVCDFENYVTDINNGADLPDKQVKEFFLEIERHIFAMDTSYNILMALLNIDCEKYEGYTEIYQLINRCHKVRDSRFSGSFREAIKNYITRDYSNVSEAEKRLLHIYHGINPAHKNVRKVDEATYNNFKDYLRQDSIRFRANLMAADKLSTHTVDDPDILAKISPGFEGCQDLHHKERTPLKITSATYQKFMQLCPDRFVRQMLWQTRNKRCSPKGITRLNNMNLISNMRVCRRKMADIAGYRTHVDYRLNDTMAESKQQLLDNLESLNSDNRIKLHDRLRELNDYAADNNFEDPMRLGIQDYDADYWSHKYMYEILIGRSEADLKTYFPLDVVMRGLQGYFSDYLGIKLKPSSSESKKLWAPHVQMLKVERNDQLLGRIIYDPYQSDRKKLTEPFYARLRERSDEFNCLPLRLISTPFKLDQTTNRAYCSLMEVINLFYSYGIIIQKFLYDYGYYELNIYGGFEVDSVNLLPNLCVAHILTDYRILQNCSDRGGSKPIDAELTTRALKAVNHFKSFRTWRELYKAHLDIAAHTTLGDIKTLVQEIYPKYSPFARDPDDYDFCSMEDIFVGPNDGVQYTELWSKQLANFCLTETLAKSQNSNMNQIDVAQLRAFNVGLVDTLMDRNHFDTGAKLLSFVGRNFEPSKSGLGVL